MTAEIILIEVRKKRLALNYSQEYMAMRLNISQSSYNKIENGTRGLEVKLLLDLFKILKIDVKNFVNENDFQQQ